MKCTTGNDFMTARIVIRAYIDVFRIVMREQSTDRSLQTARIVIRAYINGFRIVM